jgi:membrane-associated phospholipid phosphatase
LLLWAAAFLVAFAAALPIDVPLAHWIAQHRPAAPVRKLLQFSELFAHGMGILMIAVVIFQLDPLRRRGVPRVVFVAIGSGVAADFLKVVLSRIYPPHIPWHMAIGDVISGWLGGSVAALRGQCFPSGHMAAAVGLALALAALYPRGRRLFPTLAFLAGWQRLDEGAHVASDLFFGAAVGCVVAAACLYRGPIAAMFDRREAVLRSAARTPR